jgi:hypothetical protein
MIEREAIFKPQAILSSSSIHLLTVQVEQSLTLTASSLFGEASWEILYEKQDSNHQSDPEGPGDHSLLL